MKRVVILGLVGLVACKDKSAPPAPVDGGSDPSTLLPECEKADGRANADECYEKHAVKEQKAAFCDRIVGPRPKNICFQRIAVATPDVTLCTKIDESVARLHCHTDVAKKKGDAELCKKLEKPEQATACIHQVARSMKDPAACDAIAAADAHDECIAALASEKPDVCDRVKSPGVKDKCFARVATETACAKVAMPELADLCWKEVALRNHDPKLCEKIASDKKGCTDAIASEGGPSRVDPKIKSGITKMSATELTITRDAVDAILHNQDAGKQLRVVPEQAEGKVVGLRIFGVRNDSIPGLLGLENGDRLEKLNGFALASPEQALDVYTKVSKAANVDLQIVRRGQPMTITYHIK